MAAALWFVPASKPVAVVELSALADGVAAALAVALGLADVEAEALGLAEGALGDSASADGLGAMGAHPASASPPAAARKWRRLIWILPTVISCFG